MAICGQGDGSFGVPLGGTIGCQPLMSTRGGRGFDNRQRQVNRPVEELAVGGNTPPRPREETDELRWQIDQPCSQVTGSESSVLCETSS